MKLLLYFVLLVVLWVSFIPAMNSLTQAPTELRIWFVVINAVVTTKLIVDIHTSQLTKGDTGRPGRDYKP